MMLISMLQGIAILSYVLALISDSSGASRANRGDTQEIFDVTRFGAKGDGEEDDTAAIAAASRAASSHGGTLVFPKGTYIFNPSEAKILVGSRTIVRGPGTIKVKARTGKYGYIIGASNPVLALDNIVLDGLTIDQNVEENDAPIISSDWTTVQAAFVSWNIGVLLVRNCTFYASGVNTIVVNPGHESAKFENNTFVFRRRSKQPRFDNSAIYGSAPRLIATGNRCRAASNAGAVTCIDMHDGDLRITDNVTENYEILTNVVDVSGATITDNHGTGLQFGISIWATAGHVSHNVLIARNELYIHNVERQTSGCGGIATYYSQDTIGAFDGITISRNHVVFQPERRPRFIEYPRSNWGVSTQAFGPVTNVEIADNVIENAPVRGIKIGQVKIGSAAPSQSNLLVERNTILNAGYDSDKSVAPYRAALAAEGILNNVIVRNNTISESAVPFGVYSMWFEEGSSSYKNVKYYGQRIVSRMRLLQAIPSEILRRER